jgi:acetyl-CoA synthase
LGDKLRQRCEEIGKPGLYEKIADENICTELEPLIEHLAAVGHPALEMGEMI